MGLNLNNFDELIYYKIYRSVILCEVIENLLGIMNQVKFFKKFCHIVVKIEMPIFFHVFVLRRIPL